MMKENLDPLLSRREAAVFLGVKPGTLDQWASKKLYDLAFTRIGKRMVKYRRSVLEQFIKRGETEHDE